MISNYEPPAISFTTILTPVADAASNSRVTALVGPNYRLSRYGSEFTSTDTTMGAAFAAAGQTVAYKYLDDGIATTLSGSEPADFDFSKLFGKGLEAEIAAIDDEDVESVTVLSANESNVLKTATSYRWAGTGTLLTKLRSRVAAIGDIVYVTGGAVTRRRTVTGLRGVTVDAQFGSNSEGSDETPSNASANPANTSFSFGSVTVPAGADAGGVTGTAAAGFKGSVLGAYRNGNFGDKFTLTVITAGIIGGTAPVVAVTSASGLFSGTVTGDEDAGVWTFSSATASVLGGVDVVVDPSAWYPAVNQLDLGQVITYEVIGAYTRLPVAEPGDTDGLVRMGDDSAYVGSKNTTFVFEVKTGTYHATTPTATGAVITVTDTAGLYGTFDLTLTDGTAAPLSTSGLSVVFDLTDTGATPQRGLRKGDRYYITGVAQTESTVAFDKLVLDGPAIDSTVFTDFDDTVSVSLRQSYTGEILRDAAQDDVAWEPATAGAVTDAGLALYIPTRASGYQWVAFVNAVGTLFHTWRSTIQPGVSESVIPVTSAAEILAAVGAADIDNDLAQAATLALTYGGGTVYLLRTAGITANDFTVALAKIERKTVDYVSVLSEDPAVHAVLKTHVATSNAPLRKQFREGWVGAASPGERTVLDEVSNSPLIATVTNYSGSNVLVTITNVGVDITTLALSSGDIVSVQGTDYLVSSVLSSNEIILQAGPVAPITPAVSTVIKKADTAANNVEFIRASARALGSEWMRLVWSEGMLDGAGVAIAPRYAAAQLSGVRAGTVTQQGLTGATFAGAASAIPTFLRYSSTQLDEMAADGVFILNQDAEGAPILVRHALTTRTDIGALAYEEMVVTNALRISRRLNAISAPYRGRRNLNHQTVIELRDAWTGILNEETRTNSGDTVIGPAVIGFDPVTISVHPTLKDRLVITATIRVPLPLNHIDGYLIVTEATTLDILGTTTVTA